MNTDKKEVRALVEICVAHGVRHAVISPGSRNSPITIAFDQHPEIITHSIVDERSAGFVAMGMAIKSQQPAVVVCTSGSALLNYSPAVVEAFYQHIPLVVISADRPTELINQGLGQSIEQHNLLTPIVKKAVSLPNVIHNKEQQWFCERLINEALIAATSHNPGPVHINVPLSEPLYETNNETYPPAKIIKLASANKQQWDLPDLNNYRKILILVGQMPPNKDVFDRLETLSSLPQVQVWTESTSNQSHPDFVEGIDKLLASFTNNDGQDFAPDLLITLGDAIVSKRIKEYLQQSFEYEHWQVGLSEKVVDTYQHLTNVYQTRTADWLTQFIKHLTPNLDATYRDLAATRNEDIALHHANFCEQADYSDFLVYHQISTYLLDKTADLHVANSAAIRYIQLFERSALQTYFCNRGTSGIDGSTSTAVGSAMVSNPNQDTWFLTGDVSFLYDSNAFWNKELPNNLKIVVVNNSGGGIFRVIDGPNKTDVLETFLETHHSLTGEHVCEQHGVDYTTASTSKEIKTGLHWLHTATNTAVLEIFTPRLENADILKEYFNYLNNQDYGNN
ncbi:MAG: 2-succinyl-5-enolpyruvyl-6-hydroxy-3-cyclohexene-1-carboxylate synthase [Flavobacteriales bacterium]|jgi:2-succinyl-5-enolpyruvyl-6-hydroxy-3-cyclohexene-1-carboxylate synthase